MNRFKKWADREYDFLYRFLATLLSGVLFAFLIPYGLAIFAPGIDELLGLPSIPVGFIAVIIGIILVLLGLSFALWSIFSQLLRARGTPLPTMPTKRLLITGPYKYCRNPMSFGTIMLYLGISIIVSSWSAIGIVVLFSTLLILYLKQVEERELEARFGKEYADYKRETPFIIPRLFTEKR